MRFIYPELPIVNPGSFAVGKRWWGCLTTDQQEALRQVKARSSDSAFEIVRFILAAHHEYGDRLDGVGVNHHVLLKDGTLLCWSSDTGRFYPIN